MPCVLGTQSSCLMKFFYANSNQEDVFQSVDDPLARNILVGYNITILSFGQVKDDSRNATYIENLIEEYVTNYDYVAQILIKDLSRGKR
ncbi:kinesin-like protein KIN-12F [Vigna unguiculata]|uniref:kinesin-like protein KIN-12F n=1 Tax=Vigna unguiculata TaxID=3917 RepID=UPI0010164A94|nr:kinesin-like protein KIN-12F [Vigna unguiculata]